MIYSLCANARLAKNCFGVIRYNNKDWVNKIQFHWLYYRYMYWPDFGKSTGLSQITNLSNSHHTVLSFITRNTHSLETSAM